MDSFLGNFLDINANTTGRRRLDFARVFIATDKCGFIDQCVKIKVMGELFSIWVMEDSEGGSLEVDEEEVVSGEDLEEKIEEKEKFCSAEVEVSGDSSGGEDDLEEELSRGRGGDMACCDTLPRFGEVESNLLREHDLLSSDQGTWEDDAITLGLVADREGSKTSGVHDDGIGQKVLSMVSLWREEVGPACMDGASHVLQLVEEEEAMGFACKVSEGDALVGPICPPDALQIEGERAFKLVVWLGNIEELKHGAEVDPLYGPVQSGLIFSNIFETSNFPATYISSKVHKKSKKPRKGGLNLRAPRCLAMNEFTFHLPKARGKSMEEVGGSKFKVK